jgi:hypothetical protein
VPSKQIPDKIIFRQRRVFRGEVPQARSQGVILVHMTGEDQWYIPVPLVGFLQQDWENKTRNGSLSASRNVKFSSKKAIYNLRGERVTPLRTIGSRAVNVEMHRQ